MASSEGIFHCDGHGGRTVPEATFTQHTDLDARGPPILYHKVKNDEAILALAISEARLFAGTQSGEILVGTPDLYSNLV